MMEINKQAEGEKLAVNLTGRLDTMTAPDLEAELKDALGCIRELTFDFAELEYISSAGLRVLLGAQKALSGNGTMVIRNVNEAVMEGFEVTGLNQVFTIE